MLFETELLNKSDSRGVLTPNCTIFYKKLKILNEILERK